MNKILSLLTAAALALTAGAQTNVIKISQLPTVSSLSGSEKFPCVQGGSNYIATTLQLQLAPLTSINIASNSLATNAMTYSNLLSSLITAETSARLTQVSTVSNLSQIASQNASNTAYTGSNALWILITNNTTRIFTSSNAAWVVSSNINYTATNSAATLAAAAPTLASAITNGSAATLALLTVTNLVEPSIAWSSTINPASGATTLVPLNVGAALRAYVTPAVNSQYCYIIPTNILDGQQVTILVKNLSNANQCAVWASTVQPQYDLYIAGQATWIPPGKSAALSFSVIYTNIIFSGSLIN